MSVYVDACIYPFRNMVMCHMMADSMEELLTMACKIGVDPKHLQHKPAPHFDICRSKRVLAINNGAIEANNSKITELCRKHK